MTDGFESYRRPRPDEDRAHRKERVKAICENYAPGLFAPEPELTSEAVEARKARLVAEMAHHDLLLLEPGEKAIRRRLGYACGDDENRSD